MGCMSYTVGLVLEASDLHTVHRRLHQCLSAALMECSAVEHSGEQEQSAADCVRQHAAPKQCTHFGGSLLVFSRQVPSSPGLAH